jgi:hypothetical protein
MDILNFISWIKGGNYRATLPTDVPNLLAIGAKDPSRDDGWLPLAVNAAPLQSLYNKGTVTQLTSINTTVTLNTHAGVITTFVATTTPGATDMFTVNNDLVTADSIILVTASYSGGGNAIATVGAYGLTGFRIIISNDHATDPLDNLVSVHFMIIN